MPTLLWILAVCSRLIIAMRSLLLYQPTPTMYEFHSMKGSHQSPQAFTAVIIHPSSWSECKTIKYDVRTPDECPPQCFKHYPLRDGYGHWPHDTVFMGRYDMFCNSGIIAMLSKLRYNIQIMILCCCTYGFNIYLFICLFDNMTSQQTTVCAMMGTCLGWFQPWFHLKLKFYIFSRHKTIYAKSNSADTVGQYY